MNSERPVAPAAAEKRRKTKRYRLASMSWAIPAVIFLLVFFIAPLIGNIVRSTTEGAAAVSGASFYYQKLLLDSYYSGVLLQTFKVSLITTIACLLIGYPISYFMVRYAGRWNALIVFWISVW